MQKKVYIYKDIQLFHFLLPNNNNWWVGGWRVNRNASLKTAER